MSTSFSFTCSCCGQTYDEMPLCFGGKYPDYYFSIPDYEIEQRVDITESLCVVDEEHFFHRGSLVIPIIDYPEDFVFNVWTSISKQNFEIRQEMWNNPARIEQQPYFGWLQTLIPSYQNTINIKTIAREREPDLIPSIEVIDEEHPLYFDQKNGITFAEAEKKVRQILIAFHR